MAGIQGAEFCPDSHTHERAGYSGWQESARGPSARGQGIPLHGDWSMTLKDRVALVTGGSKGIGKAVVRRLLEEGATVAFCARDRDRLGATANELSTIGPALLALQADVTRERD